MIRSKRYNSKGELINILPGGQVVPTWLDIKHTEKELWEMGFTVGEIKGRSEMLEEIIKWCNETAHTEVVCSTCVNSDRHIPFVFVSSLKKRFGR